LLYYTTFNNIQSRIQPVETIALLRPYFKSKLKLNSKTIEQDTLTRRQRRDLFGFRVKNI